MWTLLLALLALVLGFLLVWQSGWTVPSITARYMAIAVLAVMDSMVGALRAALQREYHRTIFLSGLLMNTVGAALLVWLGDQLGVDLYLAAVFAFGYRIFQNLGAIRRSLLARWQQNASSLRPQEPTPPEPKEAPPASVPSAPAAGEPPTLGTDVPLTKVEGETGGEG
jgi:small basic protein